ncbi:hypothetical protein [Peristeroidobacter agariperforans]|uniref:hypothetical protein n=1 Tax=Peristeroidobacter agariperforans TaxID=268404 RepID=UPI00101B71BF|nr:hypothetical protein [Peristeroidobacter agariperforans]
MLRSIVQGIRRSFRRPIAHLITYVERDGTPDLDVWSNRMMADIWADHYREDGCTEVTVSPLYEDRELHAALAEIDARQEKAPPMIDTGGTPSADQLCLPLADETMLDHSRDCRPGGSHSMATGEGVEIGVES